MGRTTRRRIEDFFYHLFRPYGVYRIRKVMPNITYDIGDGVNFKRKEPFLLIGNHQYEVDSGIYGTPWRRKPIAVISRSLMVTPYKRFKFKFIASGIPKSQGEPEIHSIKRMIKTVRQNDPLFILPEGDINYFGETLPIDDSIAKLIKKLKVDVISAVSTGGYISSPRWAFKLRDFRFVFVEFRKLIPKEQISELSVEEIYKLVKDKLYVNDYDFQRKKMIKVGGRKRAIGLEKFIYACPECESVNTIDTDNNDIFCTHCGALGTIDEYGFIQGTKYDNANDWHKYQDTLKHKLVSSEFSTTAIIYNVFYEKFRSTRVGIVQFKYSNREFIISGAVNAIIPIKEIKYFRLTQMNVITFDHNGKHYFLRIQKHNEAFKQVVLGCEDEINQGN